MWNPRPIVLLSQQSQLISQGCTLNSRNQFSRIGEDFSTPITPSTPPIPPRNPARLKRKQSVSRSKPLDNHNRELPTISNVDWGEMENGLCINFYPVPAPDPDQPAEGVAIGINKEEEEEVVSKDAAAPMRASPPSGSDHQPQSPILAQTPVLRESSDESSHSLIENLLEENYRGQAETFVRKSSQSSVRSLSLTQRSTQSSSSAGSSIRHGLERTPSVYTPTRKSSKGENLLLERNRSLRTPSGASRVIVESFPLHSGSSRKNSRSGFSPEGGIPPSSPHTTYGHQVYSVPQLPLHHPSTLKRGKHSSDQIRGPLYFTGQERQAIAELVHDHARNCDRHTNCTDCCNLEYAYYENKAMPTSMPPEERQKIISNNRSLRNIKNELEHLAENGAISDEAYDAIMQSLPAESSLNGAAPSRGASISPAAVPTASFSNMSVNEPPPPAYNNPTPPLPGRTPSKPEISRATALYRYAEAGDCNFEVGDQIAVYEHMNADWWLGKNLRTGQEGVFPVNYVQVQANQNQFSPQGGYFPNEKASAYGGGYPGQAQQGPPPPGPSNPYNSAVPPMQIAEQPVESKPGKGQEMGKKFGKKLGNAAIFGAGATIGGNIVNSIF